MPIMPAQMLALRRHRRRADIPSTMRSAEPSASLSVRRSRQADLDTLWDLENQVFDINRMNGVGDVLHMIRTFSDIYGQRYGEGSQAPEAGIRVQTIRVAAYVDGDAVLRRGR